MEPTTFSFHTVVSFPGYKHAMIKSPVQDPFAWVLALLYKYCTYSVVELHLVVLRTEFSSGSSCQLELWSPGVVGILHMYPAIPVVYVARDLGCAYGWSLHTSTGPVG